MLDLGGRSRRAREAKWSAGLKCCCNIKPFFSLPGATISPGGLLHPNLRQRPLQVLFRNWRHRSRARRNPGTHPVCQVIRLREGEPSKKTMDQGGGEGIAGADRVLYLDSESRMLVGLVSKQ